MHTDREKIFMIGSWTIHVMSVGYILSVRRKTVVQEREIEKHVGHHHAGHYGRIRHDRHCGVR
jgi:hypothetical protein